MHHPLEAVPHGSRRSIFLAFLFLTLSLFAIFRVVDQPLRTESAPNGIVSFELARTPENAHKMLSSWSAMGQLNAAFGLGIDYLFMPVYAFTLAFGSLLATQKHTGWMKSFGALAGYGAFAAALFDAAENYALFRILLGVSGSLYPALAAVCASIKFGLLILGLLVVLAGWLLPKRPL